MPSGQYFAHAFRSQGKLHDRTIQVDGLTVRVFYGGHPPDDGWRWSVEGVGPDVTYPDVQQIYRHLAANWDAIRGEHGRVDGVDRQPYATPARAAAEIRALEQEIGRLKAELLSAKDVARRLDQGRTEALEANRVLQGRVADALGQRDEAQEEVERLRDQVEASAQIFKGEQYVMKQALEYLEKFQTLAREADEDFNLSGDQDPDV